MAVSPESSARATRRRVSSSTASLRVFSILTHTVLERVCPFGGVSVEHASVVNSPQLAEIEIYGVGFETFADQVVAEGLYRSPVDLVELVEPPCGEAQEGRQRHFEGVGRAELALAAQHSDPVSEIGAHVAVAVPLAEGCGDLRRPEWSACALELGDDAVQDNRLAREVTVDRVDEVGLFARTGAG